MDRYTSSAITAFMVFIGLLGQTVEINAQSHDLLSGYDIGLRSNATISDTSGFSTLSLKLDTVKVSQGMTIDGILRESGILPNNLARNVVLEVNSSMVSVDRLMIGQEVIVPSVINSSELGILLSPQLYLRHPDEVRDHLKGSLQEVRQISNVIAIKDLSVIESRAIIEMLPVLESATQYLDDNYTEMTAADVTDMLEAVDQVLLEAESLGQGAGRNADAVAGFVGSVEELQRKRECREGNVRRRFWITARIKNESGELVGGYRAYYSSDINRLRSPTPFSRSGPVATASIPRGMCCFGVKRDGEDTIKLALTGIDIRDCDSIDIKVKGY